MNIGKLISKILFGSVVIFSLMVYVEDIELYVNYNVKFDEKFCVLIVFDILGSMVFLISLGFNCGFLYGWYIFCFDSWLGIV